MQPTAVRRIKLTQRKFALIDDVDYEKVSQLNWCYTAKSDELGYAKGTGDILMHRLIMDAKRGQEIDHINGNPLDNRRENLRFCNHSQNGGNRACNESSSWKGRW